MATYLKDVIFEKLRKKILDCDYAPGSIINEKSLIGEFGASRTPIREAIAKLASENLVTIIPKKGILVNGIQLSDIIQIYDARILIEPLIIKNYGTYLERESLISCLDSCQRATDIEENIESDEVLHELIYESCNNKYLKEMLKTLEGHNHRNRVWQSNKGRVKESQKEHILILQALLKDDIELASTLMEQHLIKAKNFAIKKYINC